MPFAFEELPYEKPVDFAFQSAEAQISGGCGVVVEQLNRAELSIANIAERNGRSPRRIGDPSLRTRLVHLIFGNDQSPFEARRSLDST
jgi:hypothetical protein